MQANSTEPGSSGVAEVDCPQTYETACANALVNYLLCDSEGELNIPTLNLVLQGGVAAIALLAVGFVLLLFFTCGLGFTVRKLKR